ncbi:MAG: ABC transporter ATP-binding protein [Lachnospiraceae bacterium]|nr:ABC transporter ATP-binding protein [Lachnospiraceae bacterium]
MPSGEIRDGVPVKRRNVLKRIIRQERRHLPLIVLSFLLAAASVFFTLMVPIFLGRAIDAIVDPASDGELPRILFFALICLLGAGISGFCMNAINNRIVYRTAMELRNEAFTRIQGFPLSYIDTHSKGDLVSRLVADTEQFTDGLLMGFTQLFTGVLTILGTLLFMLSMNVAITLVVLFVTPLSLFVARYISKQTFEMFKVQSAQRGEITSLIDETLGNEKTVKAYGMEERILSRFDEINGRLADSSLKALFCSSLTNPSTRFVTNLVYALVACIGCFAVLKGDAGFFGSVSIGVLTCFLSYANQYMKPFNEISSVVTELQNAIACAARVYEVIDEGSSEPGGDMLLPMQTAKGAVDFDRVSFSYRKDKELIRDLSVKVTPGMKVAIVGPTGCGKTTLINLLMRFYEPDGGRILIDDVDIRDHAVCDIRASYGMVLQDTWLFDGTIKENILFGKPDATDEEVIAAAKESHAHSFIRRLAKGYDTVIGEEGEGLSQGQMQLLCITRLMLKKPPMLILDEATSSIETRTEMKIQSAFGKLMEGRTSFIVAHRLSTIRDADLILVMKDGTIVEQGKHEELLQKDGFYAKLYSLA